MQNKRVVIAVSGIMDRKAFYEVSLKSWKKEPNIELHFYDFGFQDTKQTFQTKLQKFYKFIESFKQPVSLIGFSAGGVVSYLAIAEHPDKVSKVVTFSSPTEKFWSLNLYCKITKKQAVLQAIDKWKTLESKIDKNTRERILRVRPIYDQAVPANKSLLTGTKLIKIPCTGHNTCVPVGAYLKKTELLKFLTR